jgi:hypothetical protein
MIGQLFADHVPVGFGNGVISFVIKPDRACVNPHQIRDRDMFPLSYQDDSSYKRGEPG